MPRSNNLRVIGIAVLVLLALVGASAAGILPANIADNASLAVGDPVNYTLTITPPKYGVITLKPYGLSAQPKCGQSDTQKFTECSVTYGKGRVVDAVITPNTGVSFKSWGGSCDGSVKDAVVFPPGNICDITMAGNYTISALFNIVEVNRTTDDEDGRCDGLGTNHCTLRAAVVLSSAVSTIILPAGTYTLSRAGQEEDFGSKGDLDVYRDLTIKGAGAANTIIDANKIDRAFHVLSGNLTISGVTIKNGLAANNPQFVGSFNYVPLDSGPENGGAIMVDSMSAVGNASLTLSDSILQNNSAPKGAGGAIYNYFSKVTLAGVTFTTNSSYEGGGAITATGYGTTTINNSTFTNNSAPQGTANLDLRGMQVTLNNITMTNNQ